MLAAPAGHAATNDWFGLRFVDSATGRGVPLVELETVHHVRFVTDNAGWVALQEPGWFQRPVYFHVRSHGYSVPKDGFGYAGVRVIPTAGGRVTLKIERTQMAERLYRVTGEGLYRDSRLLGEPTPLAEPLGSAEIVGQDSVQTIRFGDRRLWFWGDTSRLRYPLGQFRTSGAWSHDPGNGGLDPTLGIDLHYWTNSEGFSREMAPLPSGQEGVMWIDGLTQVADAAGRPRLVAHYSHRKGLAEQIDHGFCLWNETESRFDPVRPPLPANETWRFLQGHPVHHRIDGREYLLSGENLLSVRVPARLEDVLRPESYEAWTCREPATSDESSRSPARPPRRRADGTLDFAWRTNSSPTFNTDEQRWLAAGLIRTNEMRLVPVDVATGQRVMFHRGSVRWNAYRQCWVAVLNQIGGTSQLGEVWYAESASPLGPWRRATKIATHDRYSFYNPVHHDDFDLGNGRWILFEGTYANTFSGNPDATPRYDYNQVMYRLDLDDPRLVAGRN